MKRKMPSLKLNGFLNIIRTVMSIIFPLITYPYATRILQVENLGKVNFASSFIGYFSLIAVLGLTTYAGREGVQYRDEPKKLNKFCNELLTLNFCTTIFSYVVLTIVILCVSRLQRHTGMLLIYSATILFSTLGMEWLYTIYEDYVYITVRSVIFQVISLILMFVFVRDSDDYYIYAAINVLASVGGNIFNFFYAGRYIKPRLVFGRKIFVHLRYSIVFFSSSIASSIYSNIDTTMLGLMCSDYNVGLYSVAVKIYTMIKTVLNAVTSVMVPRLTYYKSQKRDQDYNYLISKLFKLMITFLLPTVLGINLVAEEVIVIFCGKDFKEAQSALCLLSFAILFSMLATVVNGCILLPHKLEKKALVTTISAAVVNLLANFWAIPLFQQDGAACTTVLAECVVLSIGWFYARKLIRLEKLNSVVISSIVGCLCMFLLYVLIERFALGTVLSLIAKVTICTMGYFVILYLMKNEMILFGVKAIQIKIMHKK